MTKRTLEHTTPPIITSETTWRNTYEIIDRNHCRCRPYHFEHFLHFYKPKMKHKAHAGPFNAYYYYIFQCICCKGFMYVTSDAPEPELQHVITEANKRWPLPFKKKSQ